MILLGFYKVIKIPRGKKIKELKEKIRKIRFPKIRNINRNSLKKIKLVLIFFIIVLGLKFVWNKNITIQIQKSIDGKFLFLKETIPFFDDYSNLKIEEHLDNDIDIEKNNELTENDLKNFEDLKKYIFTVDSAAYVSEEDLNLNHLKNTDVTLDLKTEEPKILIFHTHSQEDFIDSEQGNAQDTIVGVGQELAEILAQKYGITVVHDVGEYDVVDGKEKRSGSYEIMEPAIKKILKKYPSIEVCIDLHRDGVSEETHLVTEINGKPTAKIMYFNGICRLNDNGKPKETEGLKNKYIKENLALSFQMQMATNEKYPDFARKIYIKPYRYSLHMKPRSLLIEAGANTNTVEEVKNAMEPLADILVSVLQTKE